MTHIYVYKKCTDPDCGACNLIDAKRCWFCNGEELEECHVEWTVREPTGYTGRGTAWKGTAGRGWAMPGRARIGKARVCWHYRKIRRGMARRGRERRGRVRHGEAWQDKARKTLQVSKGVCMKKFIAVISLVLVALALVIVKAQANQKVDVCHRANNHKWVPIRVSYFYGWENGHSKHPGDFLVTDAFPCPPNSNNPIVTEQPPVDPPIVDPPQAEPPVSYTDKLWLPFIAAECVDNGFHVGICTNNH